MFPLIPRKKNTDKTSYGHALMVGGSRAMSGAIQLASRACLRSGAGLVTAGVPKGITGVFLKKALAEVMCLPLPETSEGTLSKKAFPRIASFIRARRVNCAAIGPGLSAVPQAGELARKLVRTLSVPVVLDADGLNAFKGRAADLKKHKAPLILTPHQKEFERLFSVRCPSGQRERLALAKKLSRFYDVTIVLKGPRTLVVEHARAYENFTGNPGMAKGGSGDVLTGVIAAFVAQGLAPFKAACWGAYFHGKAADLAVKTKSELGLLAGDIIDSLPSAFKSAGAR